MVLEDTFPLCISASLVFVVLLHAVVLFSQCQLRRLDCSCSEKLPSLSPGVAHLRILMPLYSFHAKYSCTVLPYCTLLVQREADHISPKPPIACQQLDQPGMRLQTPPCPPRTRSYCSFEAGLCRIVSSTKLPTFKCGWGANWGWFGSLFGAIISGSRQERELSASQCSRRRARGRPSCVQSRIRAGWAIMKGVIRVFITDIVGSRSLPASSGRALPSQYIGSSFVRRLASLPTCALHVAESSSAENGGAAIVRSFREKWGAWLWLRASLLLVSRRCTCPWERRR